MENGVVSQRSWYYRGVYHEPKASGRLVWTAYLKLPSGERRRLGDFASDEQAARAYDKWERCRWCCRLGKAGTSFPNVGELGWVVVLGGRAAEETYVGAVVNYLAKNRLNPNRNFYPPFDHELPLRKKANKKTKRERESVPAKAPWVVKQENGQREEEEEEDEKAWDVDSDVEQEVQQHDSSSSAQETGGSFSNRSNYRGVVWTRSKWAARVYLNRRTYHVGCYDSELAAAKAYDRAARMTFERPVLNFIEGRLNPRRLKYVRHTPTTSSYPTRGSQAVVKQEPGLSAPAPPVSDGRDILYRGVKRRKGDNKGWSAMIRHQGVSRRLGHFDDPRAAALAYDRAAKQFHSSPVLNFIDGRLNPDRFKHFRCCANGGGQAGSSSAIKPSSQQAEQDVKPSRFLGVSRDGSGWKAELEYEGQKVALGRFDSESEAAREHDRAARAFYFNPSFNFRRNGRINNYATRPVKRHCKPLEQVAKFLPWRPKRREGGQQQDDDDDDEEEEEDSRGGKRRRQEDARVMVKQEPGSSSSSSKDRRRPYPSSSMFKGVHLNRRASGGRKWDARISHGKKMLWLGSYECKEQAAREHDRAARLFHANPVFNFNADGSVNPNRYERVTVTYRDIEPARYLPWQPEAGPSSSGGKRRREEEEEEEEEEEDQAADEEGGDDWGPDEDEEAGDGEEAADDEEDEDEDEEDDDSDVEEAGDSDAANSDSDREEEEEQEEEESGRHEVLPPSSGQGSRSHERKAVVDAVEERRQLVVTGSGGIKAGGIKRKAPAAEEQASAKLSEVTRALMATTFKRYSQAFETRDADSMATFGRLSKRLTQPTPELEAFIKDFFCGGTFDVNSDVDRVSAVELLAFNFGGAEVAAGSS